MTPPSSNNATRDTDAAIAASTANPTPGRLHSACPSITGTTSRKRLGRTDHRWLVRVDIEAAKAVQRSATLAARPGQVPETLRHDDRPEDLWAARHRLDQQTAQEIKAGAQTRKRHETSRLYSRWPHPPLTNFAGPLLACERHHKKDKMAQSSGYIDICAAIDRYSNETSRADDGVRHRRKTHGPDTGRNRHRGGS